MADRHTRHRHAPLSLRLPEPDRAWLLEYAAESGRAVNAVLAEAVALHRKRIERLKRRIGA
jgi:hypothetical protein